MRLLLMKLNNISIHAAIQEAEELIEKDSSLSPAIKTTIKMLIMLVSLLAGRLHLNSKNSSKPPADDKHRKRGSSREKSDRKQGGQNGHVGIKLKKVDCPDRLEIIKIY